MTNLRKSLIIALCLSVGFTACKKSEIDAEEIAESGNKNSASVSAATYYVASNGTGNGSSTTTPMSLATLKTKTLVAGDVVRFRRGSVFTAANSWPDEFVYEITASGTSSTSRILFSDYGDAALAKPTFTFSTSEKTRWKSAIRVAGDFIKIENLKIAGNHNNGFLIDSAANYNFVANCEVTNTGVAFYLKKNRGNILQNNYIHDLTMVVDNELPDTQKGGGDFGCNSFWFNNSTYNDISMNRSENNVGHSFDYGSDGGFIEFYGDVTGNKFHHNYVKNTIGIIEAQVGGGSDISLYYNVFLETNMALMLKASFDPINFKFDNNTLIVRNGTLWNNLLGWGTNELPAGTTQVKLRNNIFVYDGDGANNLVTKGGNFEHKNNLYYLPSKTTLGFTLDATEKLGNPKFVNESTGNYRLQTGITPASPARGAGIWLGYTSDYIWTSINSGSSINMGAYQ